MAFHATANRRRTIVERLSAGAGALVRRTPSKAPIMYHRLLWIALFISLVSIAGAAEPDPPRGAVNIIPRPVELIIGEGVFRVSPATAVVAKGRARKGAARLIETLAPAMGFRPERVDDRAGEGVIELAIDETLAEKLGTEGYRLDVTSGRIGIRAAAEAGLFYGLQTLRQLLPVEIYSPVRVDGVTWTVPAVSITDYPRFEWRGLLIDPARHFIPVDDAKHFIEVMALHKYNRLQIHLTDNEGWRIEIENYPELAVLGSQMDWNLRYRDGEGPRCFGYYTQDEIRELVRYAAERHITIVPEIEMPYHAGSAIVAHPELGVDMGHLAELPPAERWGGVKHWRPKSGLLAPRPASIAFMQDVLTEVLDLFPSHFIHIGGDEANLKVWTEDPEMQALMVELGCEDAHALHSWFIRQMDSFLAERGRRMVGWDEILQGGLAPGATVMSWRGTSGGITAARAGHDVVMAPTSHTYFDYRQQVDELGLGRQVTTVEDVYTFDPVPEELGRDEAKHVLGGQGQLWGELIATRERRDFMTWPRACALSETLWSPKGNRSVDLFLLRLVTHLERLKLAEVDYRPLDNEPERWEGRTDTGAPAEARALLQRLLPDHVDRFHFETIPTESGRDVFELETSGGNVVIRGNTGVSMAMGLNWYLEKYCRAHVSWYGDQLDLPDPLPAVQPRVRRVSWAKHRYFLNYCCFGYSLPWWDWAQWERLIDWMALHGINAPLAVTGQEAVWQAVGRRLGLTDEQLRAFLAGPPYLPFGWMGCLDGWGGPLPQSWVDSHEELGRKILARERALGMTPVLQGFTGHVPAAVGEQYPDAKLHEIHWIEWKTFLLDPLDPLFAKVAKLFLEEQIQRFGTDHLYASDTFIEMKPPSGELEYLDRLARAIHGGMVETDDQAIWVLQTWIFLNQQQFWAQERIQAFLGAVPDEQMLCLDLFCEDRPQWSRTQAFYGKPWIWCNVQSFGRTVNLGGALDVNNTGLSAARRHPERGRLAGLGFVNEGLGYNPVAYDLMFEMAWRDGPIDLSRWIEEYAHHRYGSDNADAAAAWSILKDTVYTAPHRTRSVIDHVPSMNAAGGAPYDNVRLAGAWRRLLSADDELGHADTYRFDLVNVARQVLSNHATVLFRRVVEAHRTGDIESFQLAADRFLQLFRDLDELVATREEFLLGRCLEDAKRWGTTEAETANFEWNARRVLTLWGEGPAIDDYARKEWSGLISGYYLERWAWYLREVGEALKGDRPLDEGRFNRDLRKWMAEWSDRRDPYPSTPSGDSVAVAARLWAKYADDFKPEAASLTTGKPVTCSTSLPPYPARLANDGFASDTNRYWAMDITSGDPAWWCVDLEEPTPVGRVVVVCYYGDTRQYGFTVETSLDGETWELMADRRENEERSTAQGYACRFEPRPVRYLRVTQTHNSANTGRHLVEVMAFGD